VYNQLNSFGEYIIIRDMFKFIAVSIKNAFFLLKKSSKIGFNQIFVLKKIIFTLNSYLIVLYLTMIFFIC